MTVTTAKTRRVLWCKIALTFSFVIALMSILTGCGNPASESQTTTSTVITEDSDLFDCRTMANHVCGINNSQGVAPGLYDVNGKIIDPRITHCWIERKANLPDEILCGTRGQYDQFHGQN